VAKQKATGESFRHFMNNLLGMDTRVPGECGTFCEAARGLSAVLIKLRAGHNDTGPAPHRERTALWERWEPQVDFYPRMRKEWDNIAGESIPCTNYGQGLTSSCCVFKCRRFLFGKRPIERFKPRDACAFSGLTPIVCGVPGEEFFLMQSSELRRGSAPHAVACNA
jgi:hypothetical protein